MKAVATLPRAVAARLRAYNFEAVDPTASLFYADTTEYAARVLPYHQHVEHIIHQGRGALGDELEAAERENAAKNMTCWRACGIGRFDPNEVPPVVSDPEWARLVQPELKFIGQRLCDTASALPVYVLASWADNAPHVINKFKGPPTYAPGRHVAAALPSFGLGRLVPLEPLLEWCEQLMGMEMALTLLERRQGNSPTKVVKIGQVVDGEITSWVDATGYPKKRSVKASPAMVNAKLTRMTELLKQCFRMTFHCNDGNPDIYVHRAKIRGGAGATDYSTYDDTVPFEVRDLVRDLVFAPFLATMVSRGVMTEAEANDALKADAWNANAPILMPPLRLADAGLIVPRKGTIRSGEKPTSLIGTIVNLAICRACCKLAGITADDIEFAIQSDDLLFMGSDDVVAAFRDTITSLGISLKVSTPEYTAFLQRHVPGGFAYFSRQASLNREASSEWETFEEFGLSHAVRFHLLKGHPLQHRFMEPLWEHFPEAAKHADWFIKLGADGLVEALSMFASTKVFDGEDAETIAARLKHIAPDVAVDAITLEKLSGRSTLTDRAMVKLANDMGVDKMKTLCARIKKEVWLWRLNTNRNHVALRRARLKAKERVTCLEGLASDRLRIRQAAGLHLSMGPNTTASPTIALRLLPICWRVMARANSPRLHPPCPQQPTFPPSIRRAAVTSNFASSARPSSRQQTTDSK